MLTHKSIVSHYVTRPAARASRGPAAVQPGGDELINGRRRQKESHSMLMNHDLWDSATWRSLSSRTTTRPPSPVQPTGHLVAPRGLSAGPAHLTMRSVQLSLLCLFVLTISLFLSGGTAFAAPALSSPVLVVKPSRFTTSTFTTPGCTYASNSGWTCTATLKRGDTLNTNMNWSATSRGISGITFNPSSGTLPAGGSTTVQISVPTTACPASATFSFKGSANTVNVPWKCIAQVQSYPDSGSPGAVATGDLNGDGHADIVTANTATSKIAVLLNNGAGGFGSPTFYAAGAGVGTGPQSIVIADFNGDGHPDIAAANFTDGTISVLLNNGNGTFAPAVTYPAAPFPLGIAVGDFNGDGHLDIAVPGQGNGGEVAVLLNSGNGTFASAVTYSSGIQGDAISVAVSDVNGDNHPDIIVGVSSTATVAVLLNNGDGTFGTASSYSVGNGPGAVAVRDLNGDRHPDIVTANFSDNTVSVLLNNGNGTFASAVTYPVGRGANDVALGDFNGDGHLDLVTANYYDSTISVLLNNGNGTFGTGTTYAVANRALSVATGNFNADGHLDIVSANAADTITVLLNDSTGGF